MYFHVLNEFIHIYYILFFFKDLFTCLSLSSTFQEIDSIIEGSFHWLCDLLFNENESNDEPSNYVNFSEIMESHQHYFFPSHFDGIDNLLKIVLVLRVMCIKSGFYLVQHSTKTQIQLASDHSTYISLCCQHSLLYCTSKKTYIRSTFTKLCIDPNKRCRFSINVALCKLTNRWFLKNTRNRKTKQYTQYTGHMKLLPAHISCPINILNEEDHKLMSECNQVTINAAKIAQLISLRN